MNFVFNISIILGSRKRPVEETDEEQDTASLEDQFEEFTGGISNKDPAVKDVHSVTELGGKFALTFFGCTSVHLN